jgi:membrane fusion protein (multidrug efflux system)
MVKSIPLVFRIKNEFKYDMMNKFGGKMKKILFLLIILLQTLIWFQCSGDGTAKQGDTDSNGTPVRILTLKPTHFEEYLQITGTVAARNRVKLIAEEAGTLRKIVKDKGSIVQAGETLAIIENKILEASYSEAKAALNQAKLDYGSKKVLHEKRAISENEYLIAKYGLERAQAAYELNKARYSKLTITAPLNGYVNDRLYDMGAYTMPNTPIFDFIDNEYMKITAGVAERFMNDIKIGKPVQISFDAFPDLEIGSEISHINKSIDKNSRTFKIEINIPNPDRKLAPQMIANLKVLRRSYKDQIVIPLDAVIESESGRYVFTASEDNKAVKVPLELLVIYEDSVLVDGLKPNQQLVVTGHQELTEGDPLMVEIN